VLRKTVPDLNGGDWKISVAVVRVGYGEQTAGETMAMGENSGIIILAVITQ